MKKRTHGKKILKKLGQAMTTTGCTSAGVALALLLTGFVPPMEGPSVRRPVAKKIAQLRPEDYPLPIVQNARGSSFRATVNKQVLTSAEPVQVSSTQRLLSFSHPQNRHSSPDFTDTTQKVRLNTALGQRDLENVASAITLVLAEEHMAPETLVNTGHAQSPLLGAQPLFYGEALTSVGTPLRWQYGNATQQEAVDFDPLCALERPSMEALQAKVLMRAYAPASGESYRMAARRYAPIVHKMAQRYKLRPSLIFSIIHTESNFRPRLASAASAMGLMQLLPSTAGGEVHKYLYGHNAVITHEDLAQPEVNITFGATYFHLLMTQHLHGIIQHRSREICAIAAYNMGIGRLLRYFGATDAEAFTAINALTPQQVFSRLTEVLPIAETRTYVSRVSHRESMYKGI